MKRIVRNGIRLAIVALLAVSVSGCIPPRDARRGGNNKEQKWQRGDGQGSDWRDEGMGRR